MRSPERLDLSDEIIVDSAYLAAHKDHFAKHYHRDFAFNHDDFRESDRKAS